MEVTLIRSHFIKNSLGESEFDWYLLELGIPESEWVDIDEVTIDAEVTGTG